jgi:hypothetical protein
VPGPAGLAPGSTHRGCRRAEMAVAVPPELRSRNELAVASADLELAARAGGSISGNACGSPGPRRHSCGP